MKRQSLKILSLFLMILPLVLNSCLKNKEEDLQRQEQDKLKKYLTDNNITVAPTQSGLYIVTDSVGTGDMPYAGDFVDIDYTVWKLDGNLVIMTTDSAVAKENNIFSGDLIYGPERGVVGSYVIQGLNEGLESIREGGSATLIVPSDLAWGTNPYSPVGPYSSIIIDVKLRRVMLDPAAYERSLITKYLTDNSINVDSTASGIYIIENIPGTGDTADVDRNMTMNIKGSLMDGRVFAPNKLIHAVISTSSSTLFTSGLTEGIKTMRVGEKATIIVPYYRGYLGYGKYIYDGYTRVIIPPYSSLKYEVELVAIN